MCRVQPDHPHIKVREVIRLLQDDGWELERRRGSHRQYRHPVKPGTVTLAGNLNEELKPNAVQYLSSGEPEGRPKVTRYIVVIEGSGDSYSAFAPDLPGCVAAGDSPEEVERLMSEAVPLHIESLSAHGEAVPKPQAEVRYVAV